MDLRGKRVKQRIGYSRYDIRCWSCILVYQPPALQSIVNQGIFNKDNACVFDIRIDKL